MYVDPIKCPQSRTSIIFRVRACAKRNLYTFRICEYDSQPRQKGTTIPYSIHTFHTHMHIPNISSSVTPLHPIHSVSEYSMFLVWFRSATHTLFACRIAETCHQQNAMHAHLYVHNMFRIRMNSLNFRVHTFCQTDGA